MDLDRHVAALRAELDAVGSAAGAQVADAAGRLARAIDPAARMVLLDAVTAAAAEIDLALADRVPDLGARVMVDVRLRGRAPEFAVDVTAVEDAVPPPPPGTDVADPPAAADGAVARLTVRLPEALKSQVEAAAAGGGTSVNAWVTRVLADAAAGMPWGGGSSYPIPVAPLPPRPSGPPSAGRSRGPGRRIQGWVR